jgi:hypothetical protein
VGNFVTNPNRIWPSKTIPYSWSAEFGSSAVTITAWVGRKGNATGEGNDPADVWLIQRALNDIPVAKGGPSVPLVLDGIAGPKTQAAFQKFQLKWFGWPGADSRVDPDGQTLAEINKNNQGVVDHDKVIVEAAIAEWNSSLKGSVLWREAAAKDTSQVIFAKTREHNRSETLGKKPGGIAQNLFVNMGKLAVLQKFVHVTPTGILLHEMGHAAGLGHEQQRADRHQHVRVDKGNVARCCDFRRASQDPEFPGCACKEPFVDCRPFGPYDYGSTMHYFRNQAANLATKPVLIAIDASGKDVKPQPSMGTLTGLKRGDIGTLRNFYP